MIQVDWNIIIANLLSTAAIVSAVGYALKKSFETLLDARLKQVQEKSKAEISEGFRRQATIFDERFDTLKTAISLVYRARNSAKKIKESPKIILIGSHLADRDLVRKIHNYHAAIEELLFEERALIPNDTFKFLHDQKHRINDFIFTVEKFRRGQATNQKVITSTFQESIEAAYDELDRGYQAFLKSAKIHLGTNYSGS